MMIAELIARWEAEAATLEGYGAMQAATAARRHATELREALEAHESELLTMSQASDFSGYSKRRLRELVAEGALENHGRSGAPRFRRAELPRKVAPSTDDGFDVDGEVARLLG